MATTTPWPSPQDLSLQEPTHSPISLDLDPAVPSPAHRRATPPSNSTTTAVLEEWDAGCSKHPHFPANPDLEPAMAPATDRMDAGCDGPPTSSVIFVPVQTQVGLPPDFDMLPVPDELDVARDNPPPPSVVPRHALKSTFLASATTEVLEELDPGCNKPHFQTNPNLDPDVAPVSDRLDVRRDGSPTLSDFPVPAQL
jgi:hypothetical protein